MALVEITIDGKQYEIDGATLTLGEEYNLAREYRVGEPDSTAIGTYLGLLIVAICRDDPDMSFKAAQAHVESLTHEQIEIKEVVPDPPAAAAAKTSHRKTAGGQS